MKRAGVIRCASAIVAAILAGRAAGADSRFLEEINGRKALEWVKAENDRTLRTLNADPQFTVRYATTLKIHEQAAADSLQGFSWITLSGGWLYGRAGDGSFRRTALKQFAQGRAAWETLFDPKRDNVGETQLQFYSCSGLLGLRCLSQLGADDSGTYALREFDIAGRQFVKDGFSVPTPAPGQAAAYLDADTVVFTSAGSNSHAHVRLWRRGQLLSAAHAVAGISPAAYIFLSQTLDETGRPHVLAWATQSDNETQIYDISSRGSTKRLPLPSRVLIVGILHKHWIVLLRQAASIGGRQQPPGTLLSVPISAEHGSPRVVWQPPVDTAVANAQITANAVLVIVTRNAVSEMLRIVRMGDTWTSRPLRVPPGGSLFFRASAPDLATAYVQFESFLTPPTLMEVSGAADELKTVSSTPSAFDASGLAVEQLWAASPDGTQVPYFLVRRRASSGPVPTVLWGYGSGGVAELPRYNPSLGRLWLTDGNAFVIANIRGGSELGTGWAVSGVERIKVYEDFLAVAQDLIKRNITTPRQLAAWGHSNGGTLVGVALNRRPDLFNAAIIENPALDQLSMLRQQRRTPEWGTVDNPADVRFIERTSPLQNLRATPQFPEPLILTTTTDGSPFVVSPRQYAHRLASLDMPYLYFEIAAGGHGFGATPAEKALHDALFFSYLHRRLLRDSPDLN